MPEIFAYYVKNYNMLSRIDENTGNSALHEQNMKYFRLCIVSVTWAARLNAVTQASALSLQEQTFTLLCSEWPPFEYADKNGKPTAYSVEILQAILKDLDITANIHIYP